MFSGLWKGFSDYSPRASATVNRSTYGASNCLTCSFNTVIDAAYHRRQKHVILIIICPIAIAWHGTDYKINCVCLSVCLWVCHHSYGRNFGSISMKLAQSFGARKLRSSSLGV